MSLSWTDFFQKHKTYIIIGAIVVIALIILGIWWWNKKKSSSQESFKEESNEDEKPSKHKHSHHGHNHSHHNHHHDHSHGDQPEKRPINEKNFESGKEKLKGTLQLIDKTIEDLKKIIHAIKQTKGKSSDDGLSGINPVEELTERLEDTLNFIKKMNEQAKTFGKFQLEDAHELKKYTPEFQAKIDGDVKSAQEKFEHAVLLVQDLTKEMSFIDDSIRDKVSSSETQSEPVPENNE